ncbi:hypothetical protein WT08_20695 [Burkholderia sp. MSMB1552]|nr:hypothetical protein WT08_20695 [Burkholderia sp. MSMB1552]KWZ56418.1 hypothetical protein WS92_11285 [Burkholderia sp. MSMB1588]
MSGRGAARPSALVSRPRTGGCTSVDRPPESGGIAMLRRRAGTATRADAPPSAQVPHCFGPECRRADIARPNGPNGRRLNGRRDAATIRYSICAKPAASHARSGNGGAR